MINKKMRDVINKRGRRLIFVFILLINIYFVSSQQDISQNQTIEQKAIFCLNESKGILTTMENNGFLVIRINDSLKQLSDLFNSQVILKEKNKSYDFSIVISYCNNIKNISETAFSSRDKYLALQKFYNDSFESGIDFTSVEVMVKEINQEFENERYEKIPPLIEKTYQEITNVKSTHTTLNIFYDITSRSFKRFILDNKYYIISVIVILVILVIIFNRAIKKIIIKTKLRNLELRKKTLKEIIMDTQKRYFSKGAISEGDFNIKTKKIAELIRDIDRQIPLLQEELSKLEKNGNKKIIKK